MRLYGEEDYNTLCGWMEKRGLKMCPEGFLPSLGYIIDNKACGFIHKTDSDVCYLDTLIANPDEDTDEAIDEIVEELCNTVKSLGYKSVISMTRLPEVVDRAKRHGFVELSGYTTIVKYLK